MKPNAAVELFQRAPARGVNYSTLIGNDNSTTTAALRSEVVRSRW